MAKEWSENTKYNNPDIGGLVNNVKRMMGVDSGAAGRRSRNMSDFLTTSKTEGQQLKNIGQQNKNVQLKAIADLVKRFMLNPELSDDQQYGRISSSGGEFGQYLKREALLEGEKDEQAAKVALAREKLGNQDMVKGLEKQILDYGKFGTSTPEYMKQVGPPNVNELQPGQEFTREGLAQLAQKLGILRGDTAGSGTFNLNKLAFQAEEAESSLAEQLQKTKF